MRAALIVDSAFNEENMVNIHLYRSDGDEFFALMKILTLIISSFWISVNPSNSVKPLHLSARLLMLIIVWPISCHCKKILIYDNLLNNEEIQSIKKNIFDSNFPWYLIQTKDKEDKFYSVDLKTYKKVLPNWKVRV